MVVTTGARTDAPPRHRRRRLLLPRGRCQSTCGGCASTDVAPITWPRMDRWYPSRCLRCHEEVHRAADIALCLRDSSLPTMEDSRPAQRRRANSPLSSRPVKLPQAPGPEPPVTILARRPHSNAQAARGAPGQGEHAPAPTRTAPAAAPANNQVVSFPSANVAAQHAPPSFEELMQHRPDRALCYIHRDLLPPPKQKAPWWTS